MFASMNYPQVGETLADIEVNTTDGTLKLYDHFDTSCWGILFSQVLSLWNVVVHISRTCKLTENPPFLEIDGLFYARRDNGAWRDVPCPSRIRA